MGLFWDLIQQSAIDEQQERSQTLEKRVAFLEEELARTQRLLQKTLQVLEEYTSNDIDGDGKIGAEYKRYK
ncbi:MAG: hypothetical protein ACOWWO_16315 [Peptococcaceae bacterium]